MASSKKVSIQLSIPVSILKEGKYFIAYTPVLDLSTSGKSYGEVKMRFEEIVRIFFEELVEKGTLDKVLTELGWRRVQKQWTPPLIVSNEVTEVKIPLTN